MEVAICRNLEIWWTEFHRKFIFESLSSLIWILNPDFLWKCSELYQSFKASFDKKMNFLLAWMRLTAIKFCYRNWSDWFLADKFVRSLHSAPADKFNWLFDIVVTPDCCEQDFPSSDTAMSTRKPMNGSVESVSRWSHCSFRDGVTGIHNTQKIVISIERWNRYWWQCHWHWTWSDTVRHAQLTQLGSLCHRFVNGWHCSVTGRSHWHSDTFLTLTSALWHHPDINISENTGTFSEWFTNLSHHALSWPR